MMQPVTAGDVRMLIARIEFAILPADQRERVTAWLEAKHDALEPDGAWKRKQAARRGSRGFLPYEPGETERAPIRDLHVALLRETSPAARERRALGLGDD